MSQNLAANTPIKYSLRLVELLYNETIYTKVTNTNYEGSIKDSGDRVRVRTLGKLTLRDYEKGTTLVAEDLNPTYEDLIIDQEKYFKFRVDDIDKIQNDVDTIDEYAQTSKSDMQAVVDTDILIYMRKNVHGDNAIGTNYSTGTISVTSAGAVTGAGTTFTAAMVGGFLTFDGGVNYYYVDSYSSATSIGIKDQGSTSYTGATLAVANSEAYVINAATAVGVTKSNVYKQIVDLGVKLGKKLTPKTGRFLIVNSEMEGIIRQAPEFIPAVGSAYDDVVKGANVGRIGGFDVYLSELVDGNNTTGYWFIAGTREFCAMAMQIMKVNIIDSAQSENSFMTTCKGLLVWGRKVFAGNRGRGAVLRATLS